MTSGFVDSLDIMIKEVSKLRTFLEKRSDKQVRSSDERVLIRANAYTWLKISEPILNESSSSLLAELKVCFRNLTELSEKSASRVTYRSILKEIKQKLISLRSEHLTRPIRSSETSPSITPPDFSPLIKDEKMRTILIRRWEEILKCINADAGLAAMVMMGSLLESLFLAKILSYQDKSFWFKAKSAPVDYKTKKVYTRLDDWSLKDFIIVAHEVGWIGDVTKGVGEVMRDYRNFIHPVKEFSSGISISTKDSKMVLPIFIELSSQIIIHKP